MSRDGKVETRWAGDDRTFRLGIDEALALQDARDAGVYEIYLRLARGSWRIEDVRETIRLGLVGIGCDAKTIKRLIEDNIVPGRITEAALVAEAILSAFLAGDITDPKGSGGAAAGTNPNASPPPPSTEPARPSDSLQEKSAE